MPEFLKKPKNSTETIQKKNYIKPVSSQNLNSRTLKADPGSGLWIRAAKAVVYSGKKISDAAKILFIVIRDYQGDNRYAWVSVETLAADTEKTPRRVQQLIKELEQVEAIQVVERPGMVNYYRTCFLELRTETNILPGVKEETQVAKRPVTVQSNTVNGSGKNKRSNKNCENSFSQSQTQRLTIQANSSEVTSKYQQLKIEWCETAYSSLAPEQTNLNASGRKATPQKQTSPLPMKQTSPKLDSAKLENTVCKKPRVHQILDETVEMQNTGLCQEDSYKTLKFQKTPSSFVSIRSQKDTGSSADANYQKTSPEQEEILTMLIGEGLAIQDAKILAAQSHNSKSHVLAWIEYARTRNNPAGYLRTVLSKPDIKPPAKAIIKPSSSLRQNVGYSKKRQTTMGSEQNSNIDFSKYAADGKYGFLVGSTSGEVSKSQYAYAEEVSISRFSSTQAAGPSETTVAKVAQVKNLIRQLDRAAYANLKQACVEGNTLVVSFYNAAQQHKTEEWIPILQYHGINNIRLV